MVGRFSFPLLRDKDSSLVHDHDFSNSQRSLPDASNVLAENTPDLTGIPMATAATIGISQQNHATIFSIPLWRRRSSQALGAVNTNPRDAKTLTGQQGIKRPSVDNSATASTYSFNLDKDLPAIPSDFREYEPTQGTSNHPIGISGFVSPICDEFASHQSSPASAPISRKNSLVPPHSQPTLALAHAALGLGLPHTMPLVASTSNNSEASSSSSHKSGGLLTRAASSSNVRRAKSFSRTRSEGLFSSSSPLESVPRRRTRVLSIAEPVSKPVERRSADLKGKEKAVEPATSNETPPKLLVKKPSFWNRRRVQSLRAPVPSETAAADDQNRNSVPTLPNILPMTPLFPGKDLDKPGPLSIETTSQHLRVQGRNLRRRHSERSTSLSSPVSPDFVQSFAFHVPASSPTSRTSSPTRQAGTPTPPATVFPLEAWREEPHADVTVGAPSPTIAPDSTRTQPRHSENSVRVRPRSMTNPSLLFHRLSLGFFSSSPSPVSPACSPVSNGILDGSNFHASPRTSDSLPRSSLSRSHIEIPKPLINEESPEAFVGRLEEIVGKSDIAGVLASSAEAFYAKSLQAYIDRFDFTEDPLDVAVRRLLMNVGLPKETQQIDRVMEAFAARYSSCNPCLFSSKDHPYILAFSIIMLHTDAFNRSNKRKMTRADYVKNASLDGVSALILEYFFDNIVFAPFIYIEDPLEPLNRTSSRTDNSSVRVRQASTNGTTTPSQNGAMGMLGRSNKIDPYYLIANNLLHPLRVDVASHIPTEDPYSYRGTAESWSECDLRLTFAHSTVVQSDTPDIRRSSVPFLSLTVGGAPGPVLNSGLPPLTPEYSTFPVEHALLKMAKFGTIFRKDDIADGGKKVSMRKWKEMTMILTSSHLIFFRDPSLGSDFKAQSNLSPSCVFAQPATVIKPDEMISLDGSIALYDVTYKKRPNVFRFVGASGRQLLLQADSEDECNDWLWKINYASSFQTTGVRKRSATLSAHDLLHESDSLTHKCVRIPSASAYVPHCHSVCDTKTEETTETAVVRDDTDITNDGATETTTHATVVQVGLAIQESKNNVDRRASSLDELHQIEERYQYIREKIKELNARADKLASQLRENIKIAKNIATLTPFQRSTRERLVSSVVGLSKTVRQLRMERQLVICHREVLEASLLAEQWERLDQTRGFNHISSRTLPRMTFSEHEDGVLLSSSYKSLFGMTGDDSFASSGRVSSERSSPRASPSRLDIAESRSSAQLSVGNDTGDSSAYCASTSSPSIGSAYGLDLHTLPDSSLGELRPSIEGQTSDTQAEEWNKTRAAKRVSLVRLPSSLAPLRFEDTNRDS